MKQARSPSGTGRLALLTALLAALLAPGCAGPRLFANPAAPPARAAAARLLERVDEAVREAGVSDGAAFPVPGFPYLRADGYLVGLRDRIDTPEREARWLEQLRRRAREGRGREIANLPEEAVGRLAAGLDLPPERAAIAAAAAGAGDALLAFDRGAPGFLAAVRASARRRQEYSTPMRLFGLYAFATIPVAVGTARAHERFRAWHAGPLEALRVIGSLRAYAPTGRPPFDRGRVERRYRSLPRDAFGAPVPDAEALETLFLAYAPVVVQDEAGPHDRIGEVRWAGGAATVEGPARAYRYVTFTLLRGQPALQLNYAFWYPARAGAAPRLEQGPLDGFTFRVTLGPDGLPAVVDTTNNCGCYYFSAPRADLVERVLPTEYGDLPLVPARLPEDYPERPLHLRVASGWHQIQHLDAAPDPAEATAYRMLPYETLESLPRDDGRREGVFAPDGVMKGSSRIENRVFFPMGIPKVGAMRQRGRHPIALVGRRYFTEADLFDRTFSWR